MQLPVILLDQLNGKNILILLNSEKDASRTKAIEIFPFFISIAKKKTPIKLMQF